MSELFGIYCEAIKKKEYRFDAKEIVMSSLQKTIEASVEQRVVEEEGEEAIGIVLQ